MRRQSAKPTTTPSITLNVPQNNSSLADARSASTGSSANGTENASTIFSGAMNGGGGWEGAADFKDTVLFLAQQQSLHHQEMMDLLRQVAGAVSTNGLTLTNRAEVPAAPLVAQNTDAGGDVSLERNEFVSSHDHQLQRLMQFGASVGDASQVKDLRLPTNAGGYTAAQSAWFQNVNAADVELRAAKARITQLETANKLLQQQLLQKEETIRRLTESNISNLNQRIGSASSPAAAKVSAARDDSERLIDMMTPSRGQKSVTSSMSFTSPALRSLLQKHQEQCLQVLN